MNIPLSTFKKVFWKEGKIYFKSMNRDFEIDNSNKGFLNLFCKYFSNDDKFEKEFNGELRKGILIHGNCGTGKSSVFDILEIISKKYNVKTLRFLNTQSQNIVTEFNLNGDEIVEKLRLGRIHFDDLGNERIANSWGVKENLFKRIIEMRYDEFKKNGTKTYVTTNLTIEELAKLYNGGLGKDRNRIEDRLFEMFNIVELTGASRRK